MGEGVEVGEFEAEEVLEEGVDVGEVPVEFPEAFVEEDGVEFEVDGEADGLVGVADLCAAFGEAGVVAHEVVVGEVAEVVLDDAELVEVGEGEGMVGVASFVVAEGLEVFLLVGGEAAEDVGEFRGVAVAAPQVEEDLVSAPFDGFGDGEEVLDADAFHGRVSLG